MKENLISLDNTDGWKSLNSKTVSLQKDIGGKTDMQYLYLVKVRKNKHYDCREVREVPKKGSKPKVGVIIMS